MVEENIFMNKKKLKEMIIDEKNQISMEEIYSIIKDNNDYILEMIKENKSMEFNVSKNSHYIRLTNFKLSGFDLLLENRHSIFCQYSANELIFDNNGENEIYEIFCRKQFEKIPLMIGLKNPILEYNNRQDCYTYLNFLRIKKNEKIVFVKNCFTFNKLSKENFVLFFEKYKSKEDLFQREFKSPLEFEPNYSKYFYALPEIIKIPFKIYKDKIVDLTTVNYREMFIDCILNSIPGQKYFYYGFPGTGKSVTMIAALKYYLKNNHSSIYINCKYLFRLIKEHKLLEIKQNLIDEIPFLFIDNYNLYSDLADKIIEYQFKEEINPSFWEIIDFILNYLTKINHNHIIIGFDQYKEKVDNNKYYEEIGKKYLSKNNNFSFITLSSLNDKDIRQFKEQSYKLGIINYFHITELEINLDIPKLSNKNHKNKDKYDEALNSLGRTIKYYNIIKAILLYDINNKTDTLKDFLEKTKEHFKNKILEFYDFKTIDKLNINNILFLFSFSFNKFYSKNILNFIIKKIPFKYLTIKENNEEFKIQYSFPIIEEVFMDIYEKFIETNKALIFKYYNIYISGEFGSLFEKMVISHIINNNKFIIPYDKIEMVLKFVPINNEKYKTIKVKKKKLGNNKTYFFRQKISGGKVFDFLIIKIQENQKSKCKIYALQVSIYKKNIFQKKDIISFYYSMIEYLSSFYDLPKPIKFYFGYIFDSMRKNTKECESMINQCEINKIKYCFYNIEKKLFEDIQGFEIIEIKNASDLIIIDK